jgi:DNA-directed RNA polymerase specialized sigma24 family protein
LKLVDNPSVDSTPVTDATLIRSAADGDAAALERLIRDAAPSVFAYLSGMLADEREAEEAMQETFVRLARAVGRYEADSDASAWLFDIARRVAADMRPTPSAPPGEFPPTDGDATEWLHRALRALPIELREVLVFQQILRWEPGRIASTVDVSEEEVGNRARAAREHLAEGMRGPR